MVIAEKNLKSQYNLYQIINILQRTKINNWGYRDGLAVKQT